MVKKDKLSMVKSQISNGKRKNKNKKILVVKKWWISNGKRKQKKR